MGTPISAKINSFVLKRYKDSIIQNKDIRKHCGTNILITTYFKTQLNHIECSDMNEKKKFFFSFRKKYLKNFKATKKSISDKIYEFKKRTAVKIFKDSYTESQWEKMNGDRLLSLMALNGKAMINSDFELMKGAIIVLIKK